MPKGQTEIVKSEDKINHGQQKEKADKYNHHNTILTTKARVSRNLQKTRVRLGAPSPLLECSCISSLIYVSCLTLNIT